MSRCGFRVYGSMCCASLREQQLPDGAEGLAILQILTCLPLGSANPSISASSKSGSGAPPLLTDCAALPAPWHADDNSHRLFLAALTIFSAIAVPGCPSKISSCSPAVFFASSLVTFETTAGVRVRGGQCDISKPEVISLGKWLCIGILRRIGLPRLIAPNAERRIVRRQSDTASRCEAPICQAQTNRMRSIRVRTAVQKLATEVA